MKAIIKTLAIALLFVTSSCVFVGVRGDGNVITQTRTISSDFNAVSVSNGIEVRLTMGDAVSLSLEADENLHDIIITEVEDGVLKIYAEENIWRAKKRKVYLSATSINELRATSGSEIISENTISSDDLKVSVTSGADARLQLNVINLKCSTTSGADARLKGSADSFVANATSGSNIRANELEAKICDANVTSGADISVNVIEALDANASSGGDIRFSGNPKKVKKNSSSGGGISG
tara:strand:- start:94046 stop:94753 length:708 start_codon:yes stop_codon:yes gene_type:complete